MTKIEHLGNRRKLIIYFLLVIALPSLILGVLAFRGIQNDQALIEREDRRRALEAGEALVGEMRQSIRQTERYFGGLLNTIDPPRNLYFIDSNLTAEADQFPYLATVANASQSGELHLLESKLQYLPNNKIRDQNRSLNEFSEKWREGWNLEFQEKNLAVAADFYQQMLDEVSSDHERVRALNAMARIHRKMDLKEKALQDYDRLIGEYPGSYISGMPGGIVALLESAEVQLEMNNSPEALEALKLALRDLVERKYVVEERPYRFLAGRIRDLHGQWLPDSLTSSRDQLRDEFDQLLQRQEQSQRTTESLIALRQSVDRVDWLSGEIDTLEQSFRETIGNSVFMIIPVADEQVRWFLIAEGQSLLSFFQSTLLTEASRTGKWDWYVRDMAGYIDNHNGTGVDRSVVAQVDLPPDLPPSRLIAYQKPQSFWQNFMRSGRGIYLYILLLILIVLAFGLIFTIQTINRQLELSRMKSDFISTVSHEFKNPLTSIRQMSEMLQTDRVRSTERKKTYYDHIVQQSERLSHLIDNVLDYSRLEQGRRKFHLEPVDLRPLLLSILEDFEKRYSTGNLRITRKIEENLPMVMVDKDALQQIMDNLLDNALKYSPREKKIHVQVKSDEAHINIQVQDWGMGISESDRIKIFDRFHRTGRVVKLGIKGTGIGLTVVKQLVEAHGGTIHVESGLEEGSTFIFTIPKYKSGPDEKNADH